MRPSQRGGSSPSAGRDDRGGTLELGIGLSLAALILYFVFRNQVSSLVLVLLVVVLAPILGITSRCSRPMSYMRCWEAKTNPRAVRAPAGVLHR